MTEEKLQSPPVRIGKVKHGKNAHQVLNKEEQKETDDQKTEQNDSENGKEKKSPKSDLEEVKELLLKLVGNNQQTIQPQMTGPRGGCYHCQGHHYARNCPTFRTQWYNTHMGSSPGRANNWGNQRTQHPVGQNTTAQHQSPSMYGTGNPGSMFRCQNETPRTSPVTQVTGEQQDGEPHVQHSQMLN